MSTEIENMSIAKEPQLRMYSPPIENSKEQSKDKEKIDVIYNLSGEKLMSKKMQGSKKQQLDISKLPSGVYIISIHSDQGSSQQKLVLQ